MTTATAIRPVLSLTGITKTFGHVQALDAVSLDVFSGEVLAIVGDNGAGKSTLAKVISGVYEPGGGDIALDGSSVVLSSPAGAKAAGISTVYQHLALVEVMDVSSNIFLGREPKRLRWFVDRARMHREARQVLIALRSDISSVRAPVSQLSGGQRQAVAIARSVAERCRLLILDEPTAALGVEQQAKVNELILTLKQLGSTVILISHNMEHVFSVADRIAVLRRGRVVGVREVDSTSKEEVVSMITGLSEGSSRPSEVAGSPDLLRWLITDQEPG